MVNIEIEFHLSVRHVHLCSYTNLVVLATSKSSRTPLQCREQKKECIWITTINLQASFRMATLTLVLVGGINVVGNMFLYAVIWLAVGPSKTVGIS